MPGTQTFKEEKSVSLIIENKLKEGEKVYLLTGHELKEEVLLVKTGIKTVRYNEERLRPVLRQIDLKDKQEEILLQEKK